MGENPVRAFKCRFALRPSSSLAHSILFSVMARYNALRPVKSQTSISFTYINNSCSILEAFYKTAQCRQNCPIESLYVVTNRFPDIACSASMSFPLLTARINSIASSLVQSHSSPELTTVLFNLVLYSPHSFLRFMSLQSTSYISLNMAFCEEILFIIVYFMRSFLSFSTSELRLKPFFILYISSNGCSGI